MNKKRYDNVFWDWNGTIIDDLNANFGVINTLLCMHGLNTISLHKYRETFSFPIKKFYGEIGLPINGEEYEQLISNYWSLYKYEITNIPLMIGILDLISRLRKNNVKQYILSASDKNMILEQMVVYGIQDYFEDIIAPQDGYASGKVTLATQWLSNQNISTSSIILIGDTIHDYETAETIGIDCALVNRGHQDLIPFKYNSNLRVFEDMHELDDCIFSMNRN